MRKAWSGTAGAVCNSHKAELLRIPSACKQVLGQTQAQIKRGKKPEPGNLHKLLTDSKVSAEVSIFWEKSVTLQAEKTEKQIQTHLVTPWEKTKHSRVCRNTDFARH